MSASRTSCEPSRTSAYSRWRMVWQREALRLTYSSIARNLGVDESTVTIVAPEELLTLDLVLARVVELLAKNCTITGLPPVATGLWLPAIDTETGA